MVRTRRSGDPLKRVFYWSLRKRARAPRTDQTVQISQSGTEISKSKTLKNKSGKILNRDENFESLKILLRCFERKL